MIRLCVSISVASKVTYRSGSDTAPIWVFNLSTCASMFRSRFASSRMHHPGYLESINHWLTYGEKQPLDLRGQLYVLEEVVTLLLNVFVKRFLLLHITLNEVNNKGETQHRGEIVEDS